MAARRGLAVSVIVVKADDAPLEALPSDIDAVIAVDRAGRFGSLFDAGDTAVYLIRPDGHVAARWRRLQHGDLVGAMSTALGAPAKRALRA